PPFPPTLNLGRRPPPSAGSVSTPANRFVASLPSDSSLLACSYGREGTTIYRTREQVVLPCPLPCRSFLRIHGPQSPRALEGRHLRPTQRRQDSASESVRGATPNSVSSVWREPGTSPPFPPEGTGPSW